MHFTYTLFNDKSFIKSSGNTLIFFFKHPIVVIRCIRRPWSCFFFHFVKFHSYHGNLGFLSWNIIEKSRKNFQGLYVGTLRYTGIYSQYNSILLQMKIRTQCTENRLITIAQQGTTACLCGCKCRQGYSEELSPQSYRKSNYIPH